MNKISKTWVSTEISNALAVLENGKVLQQGWSPRCHAEPSLSNDEWGVLKTSAIQAGEFVPVQNKKLPENLEPRPQIEVKVGDLLMTCAGPRNRCGVPCLVERTQKKLMLSGKMYRFRGAYDVENKFILYQLLSREAQRAIDGMKTGISDSGLNLTHDRFKQLGINLAPVNEQKRIVSKIEQLFSELDNCVENLKFAQQKLAIYRKAVLKEAFCSHVDDDQYDETEKAALIEDVFSILKNKDMPSYDKRLAKYLNLRSEQANQHNFISMQLEDLVEPQRTISYGVIKLGKEDQNGVPTLRSSNVRNLYMDESYIKKVSPEISSHYSRTVLKGGEVLITIRGTLGGVCVVPQHFAGYNISREVAMIAPIASINPNYLNYFLASPIAANWFQSNLRGVAYTGINLGSLRKMPILVCTRENQITIVEKLDDIFSVIQEQERNIIRSIEKTEALRQSILKKAFSGQLVPQDPNDEPASVLLERIRTEKSAQEIQTTKSKRKKTA